jgi:hypothetical protein
VLVRERAVAAANVAVDAVRAVRRVARTDWLLAQMRAVQWARSRQGALQLERAPTECDDVSGLGLVWSHAQGVWVIDERDRDAAAGDSALGQAPGQRARRGQRPQGVQGQEVTRHRQWVLPRRQSPYEAEVCL